MSVSVGMDDYQRFREWAEGADKKIAARQRKRLRAIGKEYGPEIVAEGAQSMPSSGGLADHLAASKSGLQLLAKGVRLKLGNAGAGLGPIDRTGSVRHPVYGRRSAWASTSVDPGTWSAAFEKRADDVRRQIAEELESILREAGR